MVVVAAAAASASVAVPVAPAAEALGLGVRGLVQLPCIDLGCCNKLDSPDKSKADFQVEEDRHSLDKAHLDRSKHTAGLDFADGVDTANIGLELPGDKFLVLVAD